MNIPHAFRRAVRAAQRRAAPLSRDAAALAFQEGWVGPFTANMPRVLEYWRRYRYLDAIFDIVQPDGQRILDVGCGISTVLHFVGGERIGIDPLAEEYKQMYDYPAGILIEQGSGEAIPFPSESFDVVFCSNVLDHTVDPGTTVSEIARVLKPGGYFVLTVEIIEHRGHRGARDVLHPHSFTAGDVRRLLEPWFGVEFERTSPWIALRNYVAGRAGRPGAVELILVARR